jgi:hypothetical protein
MADLARGFASPLAGADFAEMAQRFASPLNMRPDLADLVGRFASPRLGTDFTDLAGQFASSLDMRNDLAEMARQFAAPLIAPDFWQESERHLKSLGPKARELGRRGWTIAPRRAVMEFAKVVDEISEDKLDDAYLGLYTAEGGAEFDELVQALGELRFLDPWRRSIDGAVYAYRGGYFETALSSLLGCFEGAFSAATNRLDQRHNLRTTAVEFRNRAEAELFATRYICWESMVGFTEMVFCFHPFSQEPPDGVNRHWVQHGRAWPPQPQVDCLRLLQALETLSMMVNREKAGADPEPIPESLV